MTRKKITPAEQRSLIALRAAYTRLSNQFDALPSRGFDAKKGELIGNLSYITHRIEKLERKGGAK